MAENINKSDYSILIVDDEAQVLSALRRLLTREGYQIHTASTAQKGLDLLGQQSVHIVLSDYNMPIMSGIEFLNQVQKFYPQVARIILSGTMDKQELEQALASGLISHLLHKPWEDEQLKALLEDVIASIPTNGNLNK